MAPITHMYLLTSDFKKQIQSDALNQVIGSDTSILTSAELTAIEEATSYLKQKYLLSQEFKDVNLWVSSITYNPTDRVYLNPVAFDATVTYTSGQYVTYNSNVYKSISGSVAHAFTASEWTLIGIQYAIYNAVYPYPLFDYSQQYSVGDKVFWNGNVYTCLIATSSISQETLLQFRTYGNVPLSNVAPDDVNVGDSYWGTKTPYSVPVSTDILNTTYWQAGDNRSQQMVTYVVDITLYHLHSRIAPRNIPDLRIKRYDDAKTWLKAVGKGDLTANLPAIQPASGGRIRYGGNIKNINTY